MGYLNFVGESMRFNIMNKIVILVIALSPGFARIDHYFKYAENKSNIHSMDGIDFIYVINLDKRPEKFQMTLDQFLPYGIRPYRFSAVNGWELPFKALEELGVQVSPDAPPIICRPLCSVFRQVDGKEYNSFEIIKEPGVGHYVHCFARGTTGIAMSHLSVLNDAYQSGFETIWVMEDDVAVLKNPHQISALIRELDAKAPDWDVLFTDPDMRGADGKLMPSYDVRPRPNFQIEDVEYYRQRKRVTLQLTKIGMRFGAHSMIVRRSGMKKILDFFNTYHLFFPYDIDYFLVPKINLYVCNKPIVTNIIDSISDNGCPFYLEKEK